MGNKITSKWQSKKSAFGKAFENKPVVFTTEDKELINIERCTMKLYTNKSKEHNSGIKLVTSRGIVQKEVLHVFTMPRGWPSIWKIGNITYDPEITEKNILGDKKVMLSGYTTVSMTYFSHNKESFGVDIGTPVFIEFKVPLEIVVDVKLEPTMDLNISDYVKVVSVEVIDSDYELFRKINNNYDKMLFYSIRFYIAIKTEVITLRDS